MPKRALLIINSKSRNGALDFATAIEHLRQRGIEVVEGKCEKREHIAQRIHEYQHDIDCVLIGGGDGSLNAAAAALVETQLPLAILPLGTANDLARTLTIPTDIEQALDVVANGVLHRVDLGCVNGKYFFNVANIGLGVHVKQQMSPEMKQRLGILSYAHSLFKALRSFRPFHAEIICDGRQRRIRTIQIAVGNGRHYGGGMTVSEHASIDDNQFFLYCLEPLSLWEMVKFAPALRTGQFDNHELVHVEQGREISVVTRQPRAVTADGELVTHTPAHFKLCPRAIDVIVPASYFDTKEELIHAA